MTIYVSPAERESTLTALGSCSGVPEHFGGDFAWTVNGRLAVVQRKTHVDFRASISDGRLVKEVSQMQHEFVWLRVLILEGYSRWMTDGTLYDEYVQFTEKQHNGFLLSIQDRGIRVLYTNDVAGTARVIKEVYEWSKKERHTSLDVRPGPSSKWIYVDRRDRALHIIQGFHGISTITAEKIWQHFGERIPLQWTVGSEKELRAIPGIGKVRAKEMWETLNPPEVSSNRIKEKIGGD